MKPLNETEEEPEDDITDSSSEDRKKDYSEQKKLSEHLAELYAQVEQGFKDKAEQNAIINDCWDIFHCKLNNCQSYYGTSEIYVPIVRDAMLARETRFINMLFPQTGRYADITGHDGKTPYDLIALLDHYVKQAKLREKVMPALIRTGDIGGNYALYMEWCERKRTVTERIRTAEKQTDLGTDIEGSPEYDDINYTDDVEQYPDVTVLDPRNLVVLPVTAECVENADVVAIRLKFTKSKIKRYMKDGIFTQKAGKLLLENMSKFNQLPDPQKKAAESAGIKMDSKGNKTADIFQVWSKIKIKDEPKLMVSHFAGPDMVLSCKRNPYWCDRVPVILQSVEPNPGTVWGNSQVQPVAALQYAANDAANEGADSSQYALMPIVMTDPEKNPRAGSMMLAMASVWLTNPADTKFAEFPPLWKDALTLVGAYKEQIFQSLGVNPAMIPMRPSKKPSQAEVAQEQQVALESAADNVALIQEGVLAQVLEWFYELDYQYRTEAITVRKYGTFGLQATMDRVEPWQTRERYQFRWYGTEAFKSIQQVQQMIAHLNVLRGTPPQMLQGRKVDIGPAIEYITEVIMGPRLAAVTLVDERHQMTMLPEMENELIDHLFPVQIHPMDNDPKHIMSHIDHFGVDIMQAHPATDIRAQNARGHILMHIQQMQTKAQAAAGQQPGQPGTPGGAGPGVPGQPRPGAAAQSPTNPQMPPGAVRQDNMPLSMPRK